MCADRASRTRRGFVVSAAMTLPYRRIRPMFCDVLGIARSKYLPVAPGVPSRASTNHCITLFAQHLDKTMTPGAPGSGFFEGMPDLESRFDLDAVRPGWDPGVGVVIADLWAHDEPLPYAPRAVLQRAIDDWRALGYDPMVGIELEAYLLEPDRAGGWRPLDTPGAMTYGVGAIVDPDGLIEAIMDQAAECGLALESVNSEYDCPQFEFTLGYSPAMEQVDSIFLFKQMAHEVALRRGSRLTFVGKPFAHLSGSGTHVNFSLRDGHDVNALNDADGAHALSDVARASIAGLLAHHEALTAICAPTVNAYKRLQPGQLAGVWANWGVDHRSATVRVPRERGAATRIEHRTPDGAANPYLAVAAVLQAARLGVRDALELPAPETGDALEQANTDRRTPETLRDALDALEADAAFTEALGHELVANFLSLKRDEWAKYCAAVTDWELRYYVPYL
jgi:glutamine synthetase